MNERERAEIVARAIDALLTGADTVTPETSHNDELHFLLGIAEERLFGSMFFAKASLQHEREVWRSVVKRIQEAEIEAVAASSDMLDEDIDELAGVIAVRRRIAEEVSAVGEAHRQNVWTRVQSRLSQRSRRGGVPDILRPFRRRSDAPTPQTYGQDPILVPEARPRSAMGPMAEGAQSSARARVWARVATSAGVDDTHIPVKARRRRPPALSGFALAAAATAIIALALGPLPATGFADHPATRLATAIGGYFGAEDATPPALTRLPPPTLIEGTDANPTEASALAGVTFGQPAHPPDGFQLTASTYLPGAITGNGEGTFVLAYSSADANLTIYQEAAGGKDVAVGAGAMTRVALSDGTPATLLQGSWLAGEGLTWSAPGSQSLIFERAGVLVVIELSSVSARPTLLFQVADSIH